MRITAAESKKFIRRFFQFIIKTRISTNYWRQTSVFPVRRLSVGPLITQLLNIFFLKKKYFFLKKVFGRFSPLIASGFSQLYKIYRDDSKNATLKNTLNSHSNNNLFNETLILYKQISIDFTNEEENPYPPRAKRLLPSHHCQKGYRTDHTTKTWAGGPSLQPAGGSSTPGRYRARTWTEPSASS